MLLMVQQWISNNSKIIKGGAAGEESYLSAFQNTTFLSSRETFEFYCVGFGENEQMESRERNGNMEKIQIKKEGNFKGEGD